MYQDEYKRWLAADLEDCDLAPELMSIADDDEAIVNGLVDVVQTYHPNREMLVG